MNKFIFRSILVIFALLWVFTQVLAQEPDPTAVNQLLSAGSQAITLGDVQLAEPFDNKDAWEAFQDTDLSAKVGKGVYRMFLKGNFFTWGLNTQTHNDVVIQVDTLQNSSNDNNSYGVICRSDTNATGAGYYFRISGDGYYAITKYDGTEVTTLIDWAQSSAINQGQNRNHLTAVCVGSYLALYANDQLLAETTDSSFTEGVAGFTIGAYEDDGQIDVSFDNAVIWQASTGGAVDSTGLPATLKNFAGKSELAMTELEKSGVIPSGSVFIFGENYAYFTGQGSWFTSLSSDAPRKNIVFAGELTFTVGSTSELETCSLTARINTDSRGTATTYVDVGLTNDGFSYILDTFSETADSNFEVSTQTFDLSQPHHMLVIMLEDKASLYVDGQLAVANFTVSPRSGTYGIALLGKGSKAKCEGRDIWAYQIPAATTGECTVTADRNVNKRTGPGTNFDSAGQLVAGQDASVIGKSLNKDGSTWWKLDDNSWVREDVVTEVGDCSSVPTTKV